MSSRKRSLRRAAICVHREAPGCGPRRARSPVAGRRAGRRSSATTARAASGARSAAGGRGRARGTAGRRRRSNSGGTGQIVSPPTRRPSRLVARRRRPGQWRRRSSATSAAVGDDVLAVVEQDQQLAARRSSRRAGSGSGSRGGAIGGAPRQDRRPAPARRSKPRGHRAERPAASSAEPRLAHPPGPTSVIKRWSPNSASRSCTSSSRPTSGQRPRERRAVPRRRGGVGAGRRLVTSSAGPARGSRLPAGAARAPGRARARRRGYDGRPGTCQRVGLPAGPVQRNHQQAAGPVAQRMRGDERLRARRSGPVSAELQLDVEPLLERRDPQLGADGDATGRTPRRRTRPAHRHATTRRPRPKRLTAPARSPLAAPLDPADELLEAMHVHRLGRNLEGVPTAAHRHEVGRPEGAAQLGDEPLQPVARRRRGS